MANHFFYDAVLEVNLKFFCLNRELLDLPGIIWRIPLYGFWENA